MKLSKQRELLKENWTNVKAGTYPKEQFDTELKKYNDKLLMRYMAVYISVLLIYIVCHFTLGFLNLMPINWVSFVSSLMIGGFAGYICVLQVYQNNRLIFQQEENYHEEV